MGGCLKIIGAIVVAALLVLVTVVIVVSITGDQESETILTDGQETSTSASEGKSTRIPATATPLPIDVTVTTLVRDYEANEIAADQKYKGKWALITGKVRAISETLGTKYVSLEPDFITFSSVKCDFDDRNVSQLASLRKGQIITLLGRIDGYSILVEVDDCIVAS